MTSFGMTDKAPWGRMSLAELIGYQDSRYVLSAHPRRGNQFLPDSVTFQTGLLVNVYQGELVWNNHRYVAPKRAFAYSFVCTGRVILFNDELLVAQATGESPKLYELTRHFAIATAICMEATGCSNRMSALGLAASYATKDE